LCVACQEFCLFTPSARAQLFQKPMPGLRLFSAHPALPYQSITGLFASLSFVRRRHEILKKLVSLPAAKQQTHTILYTGSKVGG
jgi:hypothetical protein